MSNFKCTMAAYFVAIGFIMTVTFYSSPKPMMTAGLHAITAER